MGCFIRLVGLFKVMIIWVNFLVVVLEFSVVCSFMCVVVVLVVRLFSISILVYRVNVILCRCGLWCLFFR